MPRISEATYIAAKAIVAAYAAQCLDEWRATHGQDLDSPSGVKDATSCHQSLAQGKRVECGAKGKPAKAGGKARKGARKK